MIATTVYLSKAECDILDLRRKNGKLDGQNNVGQEVKIMLTKPEDGWTEFHLDGTKTYMLSYTDHIASDWMGQAIHGLETMLPFCVKGSLERGRVLCTVSYWNCHVIYGSDRAEPLDENYTYWNISHTSMLQFCKYLSHDIEEYFDEWVLFDCGSYKENADLIDHQDYMKKVREDLTGKLARLKELISEKESLFEGGSYFM